jgi:cob(I)alamin adenosyltransferase
MRIYTKTGDTGQTGLIGGKRVAKNDKRVQAYGDVDELNAFLGAVLAGMPKRRSFISLRKDLNLIQSDLFLIGAALAQPGTKKPR